jgi:hypothetical protein
MNKIEKKWDASNDEIKEMIQRITDVILHEFLEMKKSKEQEEDVFGEEEEENNDNEEARRYIPQNRCVKIDRGYATWPLVT